MSKVVGLNEQRALKNNDNTLWSPEECGEAFVRDIKNGEISPTRVMIIYEEPEADGGFRLSTYAANMQRDTEISLLYMRLQAVANKWFRG